MHPLSSIVASASRSAIQRVGSIRSNNAINPLLVCNSTNNFIDSVASTAVTRRRFASTASSSGDEDQNRPRNKQEFVKVRFEPGEWDPERKDPMYLPPWKNKARVISAEDFANRPTSGFSEEFASLEDARFVVSYMSHDAMDVIFSEYIEHMERMAKTSEGGVTSHEYVVHVIAKKYNIMADRVAGIITLKHNEERIRQENPKLVHEDVAKYVDEKCKAHVKEVYASYDEIEPGEFVEETIEMRKGASMNVAVDDLMDLDDISKQAILRERREAQLMIDNKIFIEDIDEEATEVKVNKECLEFINAKKDASDNATVVPPVLPEGGKAESRTRFKYVAHAINTREFKAKNGKIKEKNTIVEQDGQLRVATVDEFQSTSWKPKRNVKEFMYREVKKAWIEKKKGINGTWGRAEISQKQLPATDAKKKEMKE